MVFRVVPSQAIRREPDSEALSPSRSQVPVPMKYATPAAGPGESGVTSNLAWQGQTSRRNVPTVCDYPMTRVSLTCHSCEPSESASVTCLGMAAAPGCLQVADRWASMAAAEILKAAEARTCISIAFLNNFTVSGLKSPTLRVLTRTEAGRVSNLLTSDNNTSLSYFRTCP